MRCKVINRIYILNRYGVFRGFSSVNRLFLTLQYLEMAQAIGVHFGNTSACVAVNKSGKVNVVANSHGDRLTPAMVTLLADETMVGFASKQSSHRYIQETVSHAAHFLGKRANEIDINEEFKNNGLTMQEGANGDLMYDIKHDGKNKTFSLNHIVKLILENILQTAQSQAGSDVNEAVFTAPIGFLSTYRDALVDAASNAGFEILRVISEPAAAALAYGIGNDEAELPPYQVIVFRAGGVTQDVTLLEICNGMISVKKHITKRYGGDVLTEDIANHFASIFERENRTTIKQNARAMSKLKTQAEKCKHVLSTMPSASCHIDSLYDGMDFNGNISRSRFDMLVSDHLQALVSPLKELISGLEINKVQKVIMSGGTSNIPRLQEMVSKLLPKSELLCSLSPSEVIAIGAATEAGILINLDNPEIAEEDCDLPAAPVDIYINIFDNTELAIKAKAFLPHTVDKQYLAPLDKQQCTVQLLYRRVEQSENHVELEKLSEIVLDSISPGKYIHIHLKYFANGHLLCTCRDKETDCSKSFTITN